MLKRHILFIHEDKDIPQFLNQDLGRMTAWAVAFEPLGKQSKPLNNRTYDLVILESSDGWMGAFKQAQNRLASGDSPILAISPGLIKKNLGRVFEAIEALLKPAVNSSQDTFLEDFIEKRLKDFTKKIKASHCRNLYGLLLNDIERPVISLILNETNGNQFRASQILGINRNTLRKKIRELKIPLKRTRTPLPKLDN